MKISNETVTSKTLEHLLQATLVWVLLGRIFFEYNHNEDFWILDNVGFSGVRLFGTLSIWNLTSGTLSNEEYETLLYRLNQGPATHGNTSDVIATAGSAWDQISRNNLSKETHAHMERAKKLRALTFSLIDLDNNQIFKDKKKMNIIKNLCKDLVILKPDKGNGIVLIKATEYCTSVETVSR